MSKKITQLDAVVTPVETDVLAAVNATETKKINIGQLLTTPHPNYVVWDDLRFAANSLLGPGAAGFNFSYVAVPYADSATEVMYGIGQLPHHWKEGTAIKPHVHWVQQVTGNVYWQLEYRITNPNAIVPASFTTIFSTTPVFTWSSGDLHQITSLPDIDMTGKTVSAAIQFKLSRLGADAADTYAQTALMLELDFHYQVDSLGSSQEFIK